MAAVYWTFLFICVSENFKHFFSNIVSFIQDDLSDEYNVDLDPEDDDDDDNEMDELTLSFNDVEVQRKSSFPL